MKRRILSLFLTLLLLASLTACRGAVAGGSDTTEKEEITTEAPLLPSEGLRYELSPDGSAYSVTGIGSCTDTRLLIPDEHEGLPVTVIEREAFKDCTGIMSVTLTAPITYIGEQAFSGCTALRSITLPDTLESIYGSAFQSCTALEGIEIPEGIRFIHACTFYGCSSLSDVKLPQSLQVIQPQAFSHCTSLREISLPSEMLRIEESAFEYCTALESFAFPFRTATAFPAVLEGCTSLKSITFAESVVRLDMWAFKDCTALESFHVPETISWIELSALGKCTSLKEITVDPDNEYFKAIDGNLYSKDGAQLLIYATGKTETSFRVPDGVIALSGIPFAYTKSLTSITLPKSIRELSGELFMESSVTTIVYEGTVAEWNEILEIVSWQFCPSITVIRCTDGDITPPAY